MVKDNDSSTKDDMCFMKYIARPGLMDLVEYMKNQLQRLDCHSSDIALCDFMKENRIEKATVSYGKGMSKNPPYIDFRLCIRIMPEVKTLALLPPSVLLTLEKRFDCQLIFDEMDSFANGGGYLFYRMVVPH